ncbi:putative zinc-binding metallopeptidase [Candidatus Pelagibacter sp. HIMB1495]|uniref:putative zinc-binding metallopeptidase n=1 Tax=unclassified Candidatus Pelagibacter TaxID=2647897 RepID=UPI003F8312A4
MKIIILFILIFQFSQVNADEIYNLIKIPNLQIYKLKNENNIRYLNAKGDFKIGADDNIACNKTNQENLNTKFPIIERNIKRYNSKFLKKIDLKYVVFCEGLFISNINTGGIPDNKNRTLILDINFNEKYFERMIHHEIFHMIQNSYENDFNDKKFSLFNNSDFKYAECSTCSDRLNLDLYKNTNGFLTEYSKSIPSEDMAEIFSFLMVNKNLIEEKIKNDPILNNKVNFIKLNISKIDANIL